MAIQDVPGKGRVSIALLNIPRGKRIFSESPIIVVREDDSNIEECVVQQVEALSENQRRAFLQLRNTRPWTNDKQRYLGIFQTTALSMASGTDATCGAGVFIKASHINHSCVPNAYRTWNTDIERHTVHALGNIDEGEEITISYLTDSHTRRGRETRQEVLKASYGITCSCRLCSLPPQESKECDAKLKELAKLYRAKGNQEYRTLVLSPLEQLRRAERMTDLHKELGLCQDAWSLPYSDAAEILICNGDLARAGAFADMAISVWRIYCGNDCTQIKAFRTFLQLLQQGHDSQRVSKKWSTAVNECPRGLGPKKWEDWLWRREDPYRQGQLVDLRTRASFPDFASLPGPISSDGFLGDSDILAEERGRHWCFLAEIKDMSFLTFSSPNKHLQMHVEDVDKQKIPLIFYTEFGGEEVDGPNLEVGHTVAVLNVQRHKFGDGALGVHLEDPRKLKIFPVSLQNLLALNDRVQHFSTASTGPKTCHACAVGRKEKNHKADCKLLRDPDLRALFVIEWEDSARPLRFPLEVEKES
ncbi:SET domain-containing protein [Aulographum hederae CBS 113979]|uniref:SET domain-containing protein n=1 Tax=Aulographum hederae CBS 113979 TaxID=1176131 RepID=A0A6G1H0E6_9PEZI|nr:SET domain-containing protein [Aulographum hederae CBS 113979]